MSIYKYRAYKEKTKDMVDGEIEAKDLREARMKIMELGFLPTKVYDESTPNDIKKDNSKSFKHIKYEVNNLSLNEKIFFTSQLQVLLSSQIPIIEALNVLAQNNQNLKVKKVAEGLRASIQNGSTLKEAMEKYGNVFNKLFIGLVSAGEMSGEIDKTFERLSTLLEKQKKIKEKIVSASIYPIILICLIIAILTIFGMFVIPIFSSLYANSGTEMPALATAVIGFMNFMHTYWYIPLVGISGGIYAIWKLMKQSSFKKAWDKFVLKIPKLSEFINISNLANFIAVLQVGYEAGMPVTQALEMASSTVDNTFIKETTHNMSKLLSKGHTLYDSFRVNN